MGYLKIDIEQARKIAQDLGTNADARDGDLNTLSRRVSPDSVWEGDAATAYREKYDQWRSAEQKLAQALRELGQVVGKIVDNFDHINSQGASALR